jgi:indolepyruvate ferredoxin oxidoreductase
VVINDLVCEGCGDCQKKSNCLSVVPVETEFGRKRAIDQSSCNTDLSCLKGFCPSFVTVEGGTPRRAAGAAIPAEAVLARAAALPEPEARLSDTPYELLVAGVGGTGVVTIGALVAMAAHLSGQGASVLDFMGFAQKGGQVLSHVRLAASPVALHQVRIDLGRADAVIAADLVVAAGPEAAAGMDPARTRVVANRRRSRPARRCATPMPASTLRCWRRCCAAAPPSFAPWTRRRWRSGCWGMPSRRTSCCSAWRGRRGSCRWGSRRWTGRSS